MSRSTTLQPSPADLVFRPIKNTVFYKSAYNRRNLAALLILGCGHVVRHSEHVLPRYKALCWTCTWDAWAKKRDTTWRASHLKRVQRCQ